MDTKKVKGLKMKMLEAAGIFILLVLFLLILTGDDSTEIMETKKPRIKILQWVMSPVRVNVTQRC